MMQSFPIFLALQDRAVLVVGGGEAAARKVELLLAAGARVTLIADTVEGEIAQMIAEARISWGGRAFDDTDLSDMALAVVAAHDEALQVRVSDAARRRCLPVNVVDRPRLSSFIMPAIVDRAPVTIAISTGGALRRNLPRAGAPHARAAARSALLLGSCLCRASRRTGPGRRRNCRTARADPAP
jgi:uroporphyrin-III C-methyltransferase/precorrin-2 dehydrogenase/sirohydrochlorin ferrochelatase